MSRKDRELDEEIRTHLEMAARDRRERGMAPSDADMAARREFGNIALVKEVTRDMWGGLWFERLLQDLRYAARLLRRSPGFTAVAVLSLALGIGANTAIFQIINAVRLRTLPVGDPGSLVQINLADMTGARGNFHSRYPSVTNPIWEQLRADQRAFSGVLAWGPASFNLAPRGLARRAPALWVSGTFFDVLGVAPAAGRLLTEGDDRRGCAPRAVISHAFWQREMGGAHSAIGKTLTLNGRDTEIVGVSAAGFFGVEVGRAFDIAVPICAEPLLASGEGRLQSGTDWWLSLMGRLKPGWSREQATAHLAAMSPAVFTATLPAGYPAASVDHYRAFKLHAEPGGTGVSGLREDYGRPLWLLLGLAALVLVIACVNLASLMLARAGTREREFAVRLGLGASRGRVMRQLLVESLLLAVIGAACGGLLAGFLSRPLVAFFDEAGRSVSLDVAADWRVFAFTAGAAVITCLLFGLAPAFRAIRVGSRGATEVLVRAGGRGLTDSRERFVVRRTLVALQIALSLVLLVGAALFTRTLVNLGAVNPGFIIDGVVVSAMDLRPLGTPAEAQHALQRELLGRVRAIPGVIGAAQVWVVPVSGSAWGNEVWMDASDPARTTSALFNRVSDGYFSTMGIALLAGRDFAGSDTLASPPVAIVNETFARTVAGGNPVGRHVKVEPTPSRPGGSTCQIVGIVRDSKYLDLRQTDTPVVYLASQQAARGGDYAQLVVRSRMATGAMTSEITRAIAEAFPAAVVSFTVLETQIGDTLLRERLMATLSTFFGGIAALLATVGLYGVIAYTVVRRTKEIGVRIALGAARGDILRWVMKEAVMLLGFGLAGGAALALVSGRAAQSLLFGLEPSDPGMLALSAAVLAAVALAACLLPARAAARIEPVAALRTD